MSQLEEFKSKLEIFHTLNPDILYAHSKPLFKLASEVQFPEYANFVETIIEEYLNSNFKINERETISTYLDIITRATTQLIESGEISPTPRTNQKTELSLRHNYDSKAWHQVIVKSDIPKGLDGAIQAIERRKNTDSTILYYLFEIFHCLDLEAALKWELNYLTTTAYVDPDIVRDLLHAWLNLNQKLPKSLLEFVFDWCDHELYKRMWSSIIKEADRLLQYQALIRLDLSSTHSAMIKQLKTVLSFKNDKIYAKWELKSLEKMTEQVQFFTEMERKNRDSNQESFQLAAFKTLDQLQTLFTPLMILSHLLLDGPNGAEKLAYAFMGYSESEQALWEKQLYKLSTQTVRRFFLNDLKKDQKPLKTIEKLCFGNEALYRRLLGELDFKTNNFESVNQQQKVINALAYNYASLRRAKLLKDELSRRFRRFMRMVHEDSLRNFLKPEHLKEMQASTLITEYAVAATEARKFLSIYHNDHIPAEEVFTVKEEFVFNFHKRRRLMIKGIINND